MSFEIERTKQKASWDLQQGEHIQWKRHLYPSDNTLLFFSLLVYSIILLIKWCGNNEIKAAHMLPAASTFNQVGL